MSAQPSDVLLGLLTHHELLLPEQLEVVRRSLRSQFPEARSLAGELIRRGWLTPFQANKLLQGRAQELVLGPYRLLERLGAGSMGEVFKARHARMDRLVALKIISRQQLSSPTAVERFRRESRAAAQLAHPNIVIAYDADEVGDTHFLAMEYVGGTDLATLVKQSGPLAIAKAADYIRQAALGLQHAHEKGLVHRDIKPANLLVGSGTEGARDVVKVLDFGLARFETETRYAGQLTRVGRLVGTVDYISPEQAEDPRAADIRSDLYSLGCCFFYLLTGQPPFPGDDAVTRLAARILGDVPSVRKLRPEVPAALEQVLGKMMRREPTARYQTPAEVAAALEPFCTRVGPAGSKPAQARPGTEPPRPKPAETAVVDSKRTPPPPAKQPRTGTAKAAQAPIGKPPIIRTRPRSGATKGSGGTKVWLLLLLLVGGVLVAGGVWWYTQPSPDIQAPDALAKLSLDKKADDGPPSLDGKRPLDKKADDKLPLDKKPAETKLDNKTDPDKKANDTKPDQKSEPDKKADDKLPDKKGSEEPPKLDGNRPLDKKADDKLIVDKDGPDKKGDDKKDPAKKGDDKPGPDKKGNDKDQLNPTPALVRTFTGHTAAVTCLAFAPDGRTVVSGSLDGQVRLGEVDSGKVRSCANRDLGPVKAVAFGDQGAAILACGGPRRPEDGKEQWPVEAWEPSTGNSLPVGFAFGPLPLSHKRLTALSENGKYALLITVEKRSGAQFDTQITRVLWGTDNGLKRPSAGRVPAFEKPSVSIDLVAISFDGHLALTASGGSERGLLRLWELQTRQVRSFAPAVAAVQAVALSRDGKRAVSADADESFSLWDTKTGKITLHFPGHPGGVRAVAFSLDGRLLLSAGDDKTLRLWDTADGTELQSYTGHEGAVTCVAFSPDDRMAVSGSADKTVRLWRLPPPPKSNPGPPLPPPDQPKKPQPKPMVRDDLVRSFAGHTAAVSSLAFAPDGRSLVSGSLDGTARIWEVDSGKELRSLDRDLGPVTCVTFAREGNSVLVAGGPSLGPDERKRWTVAEWETQTGKIQRTLQRGDSSPPANKKLLSLSADGKSVLVVTVHNHLGAGPLTQLQPLTWSGEAQDQRLFAEPNVSVALAALSADGRFVLTAPGEGRKEPLRLWDLQTGKARSFTPVVTGVQALALSPDGRRAVSAGPDRVLYLWDATTGKAILRLPGHAGAIQAVAFSPDGRRLLSGSADKTLRLWDVASGKELRRYTGHKGAVTCVAFSFDGRLALSGSADKTVRLWRLSAPLPNPGAGGDAPISAGDLVRQYQADRDAASKKYNGKVITVRGTVLGRRDEKLVLDTKAPSILPGAEPGTIDAVIVHFRNPRDTPMIPQGSTITVRGRCNGFNDILDVDLFDCELLSR
ncbi:MAG: protein kinase [Gemmataceae bacterium]|nr:protein kinase [Gemmataceae bacterium]